MRSATNSPATLLMEKIIAAIDARREGLKATSGTRGTRFTEDQKFFLLVDIFGFNGHEVARMFNTDHQRVSLKVKRMSDRYKSAFKESVPKSAYDGLSVSEIRERMSL